PKAARLAFVSSLENLIKISLRSRSPAAFLASKSSVASIVSFFAISNASALYPPIVFA
ncbi:hypothetical protein BCR34DRAFT_470285, partial [Clohesyomyces aquaticus]